MDVTLPNGTVIKGVPEGTDKFEVARKAIANGLATEDDFIPQNTVNTKAAANAAVRQAGDKPQNLQIDLNPFAEGATDTGIALPDTAREFLTGAGRGFTKGMESLGQMGTDLFGSEEEGQQYEAQRKADAETYETGMGDSLAADVGDVVGTYAPSLVAGLGAGAALRGLTGAGAGFSAAAAPAQLGALATEGAVAGGLSSLASAEEGRSEELLSDAALNAAFGGILGAGVGAAGPSIARIGEGKRLQAAADAQQAIRNQVDDLIADIPYDDVAQAVRSQVEQVIRKVGAQKFIESPSLLSPLIRDLAKGVMSPSALGGAGIGALVGGPMGAAVGGVAGKVGAAGARGLQSALGTEGGRSMLTGLGSEVGSTFDVGPQVMPELFDPALTVAGAATPANASAKILSNFASSVDEAYREGTVQGAAKELEISQSNPAYQVALKKLADEGDDGGNNINPIAFMGM